MSIKKNFKLIFFKNAPLIGQFFLKNDETMDEDQVELTGLAVQFLSNCILKILILNIKYIEKPKNSSKKIFKQQLLKNGTADFFAFTSIFQQNTSSLCRNCLLRGAFLKKGTMLIGRRVMRKIWT